MLSRTSIVISGLLLGSLASCTDSVPDRNSDTAVMERLGALGFADRELAFEGNIIRVDGDMILHRDHLLAGDYETKETLDLDEKGYKYFTVASAYRNSIKLQWATGTQTPDQRIKDAFTQAALDWSSVPNSTIRISTTNTGKTITIHQINGFDWPGASGCPGTNSAACTDLPISNQPSAHIWIKSVTNTDPSIGPCDWTASTLNHVARHELGHAIGFDHPKELGSAWIAGSSQCTGTSTTCPSNPGYSTVMIARFGHTAYPQCYANANSPTALTSDDKNSCGLLY